MNHNPSATHPSNANKRPGHANQVRCRKHLVFMSFVACIAIYTCLLSATHMMSNQIFVLLSNESRDANTIEIRDRCTDWHCIVAWQACVWQLTSWPWVSLWPMQSHAGRVPCEVVWKHQQITMFCTALYRAGWQLTVPQCNILVPNRRTSFMRSLYGAVQTTWNFGTLDKRYLNHHCQMSCDQLHTLKGKETL